MQQLTVRVFVDALHHLQGRGGGGKTTGQGSNLSIQTAAGPPHAFATPAALHHPCWVAGLTWNSHWRPTGMTMRPPGFSFLTSTSGSEDAAAHE